MKAALFFGQVAALLIGGTSAFGALDEVLDRADEFFTLSAFHGTASAQLRGLLDLEAYSLGQPPPGLIYADRQFLFNPRLTGYLDVQLGRYLYAFAQARIDRGFDPGEGTAQARFDEYALRFSPAQNGSFSLQVGKFATVVGNWVGHHDSWANPFINSPGPYENLTSAWDSAAPGTAATLLDWGNVRDKHQTAKEYAAGARANESKEARELRLPIVWGPSYGSGLAAFGRLGCFEYAAELKNTALSSRPETWDVTHTSFDRPAFNGRLGFRPSPTWNFGVSLGSGAYLQEEATPTLPKGREIGDYREWVIGEDASFEWRHLQIWAECYEARFEIPLLGAADVLSYYLEAKYKITPQLYGALRWNHQLYGEIPSADGAPERWGNDLWRPEFALGYRFTARTQLKLQYSIEHEQATIHETRHTVAGQLTIRF